MLRKKGPLTFAAPSKMVGVQEAIVLTQGRHYSLGLGAALTWNPGLAAWGHTNPNIETAGPVSQGQICQNVRGVGMQISYGLIYGNLFPSQRLTAFF